MKFVEFNIGKEHFGINIDKVKYIEQFHEITHVPDIPEHIEGVINLHGETIPVYNLHAKFGLNHIDFNDDTVFMIVDISNISIAIIADDVSEIVDSEDYEMEPAPKIILGNSRYISDVLKLTDKILMILDVDKIVDMSEKEKISEMVNQNLNQE